MDINFEEALDEFDVRYLECYHQMTTKLASLALEQTLVRLSSPLLGPREMYEPHVSLSPAMGPPKGPPRPIRHTSGLAFGGSSEKLQTPSHDPIYQDPVENKRLSQVNSIYSESLSDKPIYSTQTFNTNFAQNVPTHQPVQYNFYSPLVPASLEPVLPVASVENRPLKLHRLLLALAIIAKTSSRRARDRRNTVATYVGNPFYRGKNSPQRRKSRGTTEKVEMEKMATLGRYDFDDFENIECGGPRFQHFDFGRGRLEEFAGCHLYRS